MSGFLIFSLGSVCVTSERLLVPRVVHSLAYCSPLPLLLILPYIRERADSLPCLFSFPLFLSPPLHLEHPTSVLDIFLSSSKDLIWACGNSFLHLEDPNFQGMDYFFLIGRPNIRHAFIFMIWKTRIFRAWCNSFSQTTYPPWA